MSSNTHWLADRIATGMIRGRWFWGCLAILLTILAWKPSTQLQFDQSIESLYSQDDPVAQAFQRSKSIFGGDEFALIAFSDPELNTPAGLERVRSLARSIQQIPGIQPDSVQDLASTLAQARIPFVSIPEASIREQMTGVLLGEDQQTTAVVARFQPVVATAGLPAAPVPRTQTVQRLRETVARFSTQTGFETHLVGEPVQVLEAFRYVEEDGLWLWVYSSGLLMLVILVLFRSLRWTVLPLLVVIASVVWTRAALVLSEIPLSMVSSMLNSLVTIIGIATVVHVAVQFRERRNAGHPREEALRLSIEVLIAPVFWTVTTTAIGFAVLMSSEISPVRSFGVMMVLGTLMVLPAVAWLVPLGVLAGRRDIDVHEAPAEGWLNAQLQEVARTVNRSPGLISLALLALTVLAGIGCLWLHVESDFSKNFRAHTPIVRGLDFVETRLGGAGTFEVNFPTPAELTPEFLNRVDAFAGQLRQITLNGQPGLTKVVSLAEGEALIPRTLLTASLARRLWILERMQPDYIRTFYHAEQQRMRIMLRVRERQPSEDKLHIIAQVDALAKTFDPQSETTGLFVVLTNLIDSLMRDQWVSFVLAGVGILAAMAIAFRNLSWGLISLLPNMFPILLVIGTMGWIGLPVNMATAMISSVSMGLTVDSSIHFLSGFQRARERGLTFVAALEETNRDVGRALLFANLALVAGFLVLSVSHFLPLAYFGILISLAMLGGLIGNLILLPVLLRWIERD